MSKSHQFKRHAAPCTSVSIDHFHFVLFVQDSVLHSWSQNHCVADDPASTSQGLGSQVGTTSPSLCSAGEQTQGFVRAMLALYQLCYNIWTYSDFFFHRTLIPLPSP